MSTIAHGASGQPVRDVQGRLHALGFRTEPDEPGVFGAGTESAIREFQQRRHLLVDGVIGPDTWQEMVEAGHVLGDRVVYLRQPMMRGDDVRTLQARLNAFGFDAGREDGIFGPRSDRALREFQRNVGLPDDGIAGDATVHSIARLRLDAHGPIPGLREREAMRQLSPHQMRDALIAIDAGHGANDPGGIGPTGLREADVAFDLSRRLCQELRARGAAPFLLRRSDDDPTPSERARIANEAGAGLLIGMHLNSHAEPDAEGTTVFYCGLEDWVSPAGHRLAELIQRELTALDLVDGRTHPKWLPILRETRMPAVRVEPCHITNPREEASLRDAGFREAIVRAVADGVERYFAGVEPTTDQAEGPSSGSVVK
jgi:N-acetylmuramoyl-L-alanine amidase